MFKQYRCFLFFLIYVFLLCPCLGTAQVNTINYEHYGVDQGLPTQSSYYTIQDKHGFLWIATDAGLCRFDGRDFVTYTSEDGLGDDEIMSLYQDKKDRVWCMPFSKKISYYYKGKFYSEDNDSMLKQLSVIYMSGVMRMAEDAEGNIYLPARNLCADGIKKIGADNKVTTIKVKHLFKSGLAEPETIYTSKDRSRIFCVILNEKKIIEIKASGEVIDVTPQEFSQVAPDFRWHHNPQTAECLYIGDDSIYLVDGVNFSPLMPVSMLPGKYIMNSTSYKIDRYRNIWITHPHENVVLYRYVNGRYLSGIKILKGIRANVCFDNEDNIWLPTSTLGLFKIHYSHLMDDVAFRINDNVGTKRITCCFADCDGSLWLGYNNGTVSRYMNGKVINYGLTGYKTYFNRVLQIKADRNGDVYCVSDRYCMVFKRKSAFNYEQPRELVDDHKSPFSGGKGIYFDRDSIVCFSNMNNFQYKLIPGTVFCRRIDSMGSRYNRVFSNYIDSKGRKYQSTASGLMWLRGKAPDSVTLMGGQDPRLKTRILGFAENSEGVVFMATYSDGVIAMKDNKVLSTVSRAQGLAGTICRRIFCLDDTLYVATNGGISIMVFSNNRFNIIRNLGLPDGLVSIDVNDLCFYGNTMYMATSQGISRFTLPVRSPGFVAAPIVSVLVFKANETIFNLSRDPVFPYRGQRVSVKFIAPVMDKPQLVQYRYRLSGKDNEWHVTHTNELEFSGLNHGDYLLEIQAKKYNSNWGASEIIRFRITPPFYNSWWFTLLLLLSLAVFVWLIFRSVLRRRLRQQLAELKEKEAVERERQRIAADIHDDIGADLTNMVMLSGMLKSKNEPSLTLIDRLESSSHEIINKMNEIIWMLNTANDNMFGLVSYLNRYAENYFEGSGISYHVTIAEQLYSKKFLTSEFRRNLFLVYKECLHNILKHSKAGIADIDIADRGSSLCIIISDNGEGFETALHYNGNGLLNMKKRIETIGGMLYIESAPGKGCKTTITVPYSN